MPQATNRQDNSLIRRRAELRLEGHRAEVDWGSISVDHFKEESRHRRRLASASFVAKQKISGVIGVGRTVLVKESALAIDKHDSEICHRLVLCIEDAAVEYPS